MNVDGFANPWEHVRLLSDARRNEDLLETLRARAPGKRVLEVGCGTGLLSVIAARCGATKVYAVEPTPLRAVAEQIVRDNGLEGIVEVLGGLVQDLEVRPVDLAFSELLNADPFYEGVVPAMFAAAKWVVPGGILAPQRLRVKVALCRARGSAAECRSAHREIDRTAELYDLKLDSLKEALSPKIAYPFVSNHEEPASHHAVAWDVPLGVTEREPGPVEVDLEIIEPGPIAGAMVWFEADLGDNVVMHNAPGSDNHWGQQIYSWAEEKGYRAGEKVRVRLEIRGDRQVTVVRV